MEKSTQQSAVSIQPPETSTQHSAVSTQPMDIDSNPAEKKIVSGPEILSAIREMAERLGRFPSMPELRQAHPEIKMGTVRKYFAGYGEALRQAGFEGGGCGYTVTMDALFRDWAGLARKFKRCPTMSEYERDSKYSVRPLVGRFRVWSQAPRGLYGYAEREELDVEFGDVMEMIREHYGEGLLPQRTRRSTKGNQNLPRIGADPRQAGTGERGSEEQLANGNPGEHGTGWQLANPNPRPLKHRGTEEAEEGWSLLGALGLDKRTWQAREMRQRRAPVLPDRPIFGPPMVEMALACGPTNENGVIYLFGSLARQLGFVVMKIQTEFPDCLALRYIGDDRWQLVRIEFEFESRNFLKHMHDPKGCDLIVCWEHNWRECPVEVVELRQIAVTARDRA